MQTKYTLAAALAFLVTHAPAQRSILDSSLDLRSRAERAEDQRSEMLRLQREANEELRSQTRAARDAAHDAWIERLERSNAEADAREEARKTRAVVEYRQLMRDLQPKVAPAPPTEYRTPTAAPAAPPSPTAKNLYDPAAIPTFAQYMAAHEGTKPLAAIRQYRDEVKLRLLSAGEYNETLVEDVDRSLFQHAMEERMLDSTDEAKAASQFFAPAFNADANDAGLVHRLSLDDGDTAAGDAALLYKSLLSDQIRTSYVNQAEYQGKLDNAKLRFESVAPPKKIATARRAAVERGDIPFAVIEDAYGTKSFFLGPEMKKCIGNDAALATIFKANPNLDRNLIGAVRKQLRNP